MIIPYFSPNGKRPLTLPHSQRSPCELRFCNGNEKNKALAFEAAAEGIVLLENDGVLPVSPGKPALFGAGAAYTIYGGSGRVLE